MIAIVDYDMANLRSVQKALEAVGHAATIVRTPEALRDADRVILPGVGAFKDAVRVLRERGLDRAVLDHIHARKPFLGICLGYQMLFETGLEDGVHRGLGVFKGEVARFDIDATRGLKVPHMGWNTLTPRTPSPLLRGLGDAPSVYFVHSYFPRNPDPSIVATTTDYGGEFASSLWKENVLGTQFHPEKSQKVGLTMLKNFAEM